MSEYKASIIIPILNKWELTRACLESIAEHTEQGSYEVIVVDNGSTDASATELPPFAKALFAENFRYIRFDVNTNFGPASNAGAAVAKHPYLFFLNNDTLVTKGWLPPLFEGICQQTTIGAVGPLLLYEDNTVQHVGVSFVFRGMHHLYGHLPSHLAFIQKKRKVQALTGAALMISASLFKEVGGFFEGYQNGYEDLDLCIQLKRLKKILYCLPASKIYHLESQTTGRKAHEFENSMIFMQRCLTDVEIDIHRHALADGFTVDINELLEFSVVMTEEDEKNLLHGKSKRIDLLIAQCQEFPFWVAGRRLLVTLLKNMGELLPAVNFLGEVIQIVPNEKDCCELLSLIEKEETLVAASFFEDIQSIFQRCQRNRAETALTKKYLNDLREQALVQNDSFLLKLMQQMFSQYHLQGTFFR